MSSTLGIFDSGVGGLTVFDAIQQEMPKLSTIYLADQLHFPYGRKSPASLIRYGIANTAFLASKGANAILIACHTASAFALKPLQNLFPYPIFSMIEPTLEKALATTKNGRIALLGTEATIKSNVYQNAAKDILMIPFPLQELIDEIEKENLQIQCLFDSLAPIKTAKVDTAILACTHFAHIEKQIASFLGNEISVINPAKAVAKELSNKLSPKPNPDPNHTFYTSGDPTALEYYLQAYLGGKFSVQFLPQND